MKLIQVTIHGYKRFKQVCKMNLDGKITAIVGPNEAGKSSFLRALQHLNEHDDIISSGSSQELTRNTSIPAEQTIVEAKFLLEEADRKAIAHIPEATNVRWLTVSRRAKGATFYVNQIPLPNRNLLPRQQAVTFLKEVILSEKLAELDADTNKPYSTKDTEELIGQLDVKADTLPDDLLKKIRDLSAALQSEILVSDTEDLQELPSQLLNLAEHESQIHPRDAARSILFRRRPKFLFFDDSARLLESEYALDKVGANPPSALQNLARLAKLNLQLLTDAITANDQGLVETLEEQANTKLAKFFSENWSQSGITVRLRVDGATLNILVRDSQTSYVRFAERSDGLRQFVALLAFVAVEATDQPPILLIDEAETHLHYDAQADLVQMLARQEIASKVVYTTHSVGCLPEDLGTGIRLIEAIGDGTSVIRNWFWDNSKQGFSPLLFGMGARTLAYFPVRYALVTEGATDLILLPTLIREATSRAFLGFQVVPGLSSASEDEVGLLERESPRTAYLVDADKAGDDIRRKLTRAKIPPERIFSLPDSAKEGLVLEDFIRPNIYIAAVNEELRRSYGDSHSFPIEELPNANRPKAISDWCKGEGIKPPNKRAIAYHILEYKSNNPDQPLLLDQHKDSLQYLYSNICAVLKLPAM